MKAIALIVVVLIFLISLLAHADHLALQKTIADQQDCQLCNQGIDTPPELSEIQAIIATRYSSLTIKITIAKSTFSQFFQPLLRAPPFIQ